MKIQWTSHLKDEDEKKRFESRVQASRPVLERLSELIDERERAINTIETGVEVYKQPGWEGAFAHYNGERASLKYIKNLINLDQQIVLLTDK